MEETRTLPARSRTGAVVSDKVEESARDALRKLGPHVRGLEARVHAQTRELELIRTERNRLELELGGAKVYRQRAAPIVQAACGLAITLRRLLELRGLSKEWTAMGGPNTVGAADVATLLRILGEELSRDAESLVQAVRVERGDPPTPHARPGDVTGGARATVPSDSAPPSVPVSLFGDVAPRSSGDPC